MEEEHRIHEDRIQVYIAKTEEIKSQVHLIHNGTLFTKEADFRTVIGILKKFITNLGSIQIMVDEEHRVVATNSLPPRVSLMKTLHHFNNIGGGIRHEIELEMSVENVEKLLSIETSIYNLCETGLNLSDCSCPIRSAFWLIECGAHLQL